MSFFKCFCKKHALICCDQRFFSSASVLSLYENVFYTWRLSLETQPSNVGLASELGKPKRSSSVTGLFCLGLEQFRKYLSTLDFSKKRRESPHPCHSNSGLVSDFNAKSFFGSRQKTFMQATFSPAVFPLVTECRFLDGKGCPQS